MRDQNARAESKGDQAALEGRETARKQPDSARDKIFEREEIGDRTRDRQVIFSSAGRSKSDLDRHAVEANGDRAVLEGRETARATLGAKGDRPPPSRVARRQDLVETGKPVAAFDAVVRTHLCVYTHCTIACRFFERGGGH